jgi:hypothetical protein
MWRWMLSGRNALINLVVAAFVIFVVFNVVRGGEERGEPPRFQRSSSGNEFRISKPISASEYIEIDGHSYLLLMAKHDNERIETADLRIISADPGGDLEQAGWIHTSMSIQRPPEALAYARGHVYVGLTREGTDRPALWVVDLSNPNRPFEANLINADMPIRSLVASEDGYLVASGFDDEFLIYDITRPNEPEVVASFRESVSMAPRLHLRDDVLFVDHVAGVVLLDMTDPASPSRIGEIAHPNWREPVYRPEPDTFLLGDEGFEMNVPASAYLNMAAGPDLIAVASGEDGATLHDWSSTVVTGELGGVLLDGRTASVAIDGDYLFTLTARLESSPRVRFSVNQIDISDPTNPRIEKILGTYAGIPRYQDIIAHDENVLILFNDTVIRIR